MVTRKYTRDYRIETTLDRRGKIRERAIYCGAYYRFKEKKSVIKKHLRNLAILSILVLLTTVLPMAMQNTYMDQFYVFLPHAFAVIPTYLLFAAIRRIYMAGDEKVTHEHSDKIVLRLSRATVFLMVVSILSAAVLPVYIIFNRPGIIEWIMMAATAGRLALAYALLPMRKKFAMEELAADSGAAGD